MMMYSDTSRAQSWAGTLSKKMSGSGPYFSLSGNRSCTSDSDSSVKIKLIMVTKKAVSVLHFSCGYRGSSLIGAGSGISIRICPFELFDLCWRMFSSSSSTKYSLFFSLLLALGRSGCLWYKSTVTRPVNVWNINIINILRNKWNQLPWDIFFPLEVLGSSSCSWGRDNTDLGLSNVCDEMCCCDWGSSADVMLP